MEVERANFSIFAVSKRDWWIRPLPSNRVTTQKVGFRYAFLQNRSKKYIAGKFFTRILTHEKKRVRGDLVNIERDVK